MKLREKQELFAQEYARNFDDVYRYVCYRVCDTDDAQDVVSEACAKAFAKLSEFEPSKGGLRPWLMGIAKNEMLMYWRSKKPLLSLEVVEPLADVTAQEHRADVIDDSMLTEKIFAGMSPETKALVALRYVDDLSFDELAEVTGKESAALRQFFSRLHRSLRVEFQDSRA